MKGPSPQLQDSWARVPCSIRNQCFLGHWAFNRTLLYPRLILLSTQGSKGHGGKTYKNPSVHSLQCIQTQGTSLICQKEPHPGTSPMMQINRLSLAEASAQRGLPPLFWSRTSSGQKVCCLIRNSYNTNCP